MPYLFQREFAAEFSELLSNSSRNYRSEIGLVITLSNATKLYLGTRAFVLEYESRDGTLNALAPPLTFDAKISGAPEVKQSQAKVPDLGIAELVNLDYAYTQLIADAGRLYDGALVEAYLCLPNADGAYIGNKFFSGLVRDLQGDDEAATLTFIHHLSSRAAVLGKEMTQRCVNVFTDEWCGVPAETVPESSTCSKVWNDKTNGCLFWGGCFNGVPFLNPNNIVSGYGGASTGTGWQEDGNCAAADSWFLSDGCWLYGRDIRKGDLLLTHLGAPVLVDDAKIVRAEHCYEIRAGAVSLVCSASHKLLTAIMDAKGRAAHELRAEDELVIVSPHWTHATDDFVVRPVDGREVLRLTTSAPHMYVAGAIAGSGFASHNIKQPWTVVV